MYSPFTKITYMLTFPSTSKQFLRAIWDAVSQATVLILAQIKFNSLRITLGSFFQSAVLGLPFSIYNFPNDLIKASSLK